MTTYGSVAKSVREMKDDYPEHYCPARNCLWRTFDARDGSYKPCPKGIGHGLHPNVKGA